MSSSSKRHEKHSSLSNHSLKPDSHSNSGSHSNSQINEEEDPSNSNSNSISEQFADEGLLQKIESMPSLDSEFLMSPNLEFPNFSKKEALQASDDINSINSKAESESENMSKNDSSNFPSIMPDELPILDSPINNANKQNEVSESSGTLSSSNPHSNEPVPSIQANTINQNTKPPLNTHKNTEIVAKRRDRATFSKVYPLSKKSSFPRFSNDIYTYDLENEDDDFDPSSELPMPMLMTPTSPESHSKRRKTLPLKRSSLMENEREAIEKANSKNNPKFLGNEGIEQCEPTLLKTCHLCSQKIEKEGAFINGFYYHKKCLVCSKCGKRLEHQQKCFMYQEKLMCEDCVHVDLHKINVCKICGQKIFNQSEEVHLPNGLKVHSTCTSCYMCGKQLPLDEMVLVNEDEQVENDFKTESRHNDDQNQQKKSRFRRKSKGKIKEKPQPKQKKKICNDRRTSNFSCDTLFVEEDGIKMPKYVCKKCHSHLMKDQICCMCKRPILENIVVKNQRVFHRRCFRCEHPGCNLLLYGNSYVVHHNTFLCWEHGKIFSISCAYCKQLFKTYETDRIKWHSKLYHKCCFVCRVCGETLDPQLCMSVHGRPHCEKCFQIRVREGDCDQKGRSLYVHYNQMHKKHRKIHDNDNDDNVEEEEEEINDNDVSESSTSTSSVADFDVNENNKKKHDTHLHLALAAEKRKNRFFLKYHVNVNWPEYGEKNFERAQPYRPEEDKNVFKKF